MVPLAKVQQLTGINANKVEMFLRDNQHLPYLYDPITQSAVYYEKNVPLYQEAQTFYDIIKEKYDEKAKALIMDTREEIDDIDLDDLDREPRHKKHGHGHGHGKGPFGGHSRINMDFRRFD